MKEGNMFFIIISIFAMLLLILWVVFIKPSFKYFKKSTHKMRELVFPDLANINKTIITISSASIVLTVQFIGKPFIAKQYLLMSWMGFSICISLGVILLISQYTHRLTDHMMMNEFMDLDKDPKNKENARELLDNHNLLMKVIYVSVVAQAILLFLSLIILIIFGYSNINIILG